MFRGFALSLPKAEKLIHLAMAEMQDRLRRMGEVGPILPPDLKTTCPGFSPQLVPAKPAFFRYLGDHPG